MKSTRKDNSSRLVSDGFVPRSRTITRTISAHHGRGLCDVAGHIQPFQAAHAELRIAIKRDLLRSARRYSAFSSDCLPDVLLQVIVHDRVAEHCPRTVRVLKGCDHGR